MAREAEQIVEQLFQTPEGRRAPYPLYHELRERAPVHKSETLGLWLVSSYDGVSSILRDPRFGKNFERQIEATIGPDWEKHSAAERLRGMLVNIDGPDHTRLRKKVIKAFQRKNVERLRPVIERMVSDLLDPFEEAGGGDLLQALAFPLPVTVIGEILGVPEADREQFRKLVADLLAVIEVNPSEDQLVGADAASDAIYAYFEALIAEKRRQPCDDLLSTLACDSEDPLTVRELVGMATLLFVAGFETTTNLVGNSMLGLLEHPDALAALRADPDGYELLADEMLRYDGTAQMISRHNYGEVDMGGVIIPAGEPVVGLLGAANHDPAEFENPDALDLDRGRIRPLSFGGGTHFCLGAQLARAEIDITLRGVVRRFGTIELAGERPRYRDRLTLRGLESLELECRREAARSAPVSRPRAQSRAHSAPAPKSAPVVSLGGGALGLRPAAGHPEADARWRNEMRRRVETRAGDRNTFVQTGASLTATIVLLARSPLFRGCSPDEIQDLAETAYPISFEPGEPLTVEGAESLECYVISEGEAQVTIGGEPVRTVREYDVVGERGLLEKRARTATVTADGEVISYAISRERLAAVLDKNPELAELMLAHTKERYAD